MERMSSKKTKGVVVVPIQRKRLHPFSGTPHRRTGTKIAPANINSLNGYQTAYSAQHDYNKKNEYDRTLFNEQRKKEMESTALGTIGFEMSEILSKHTKPMIQPRIIRLRSHRHRSARSKLTFNESLASFTKHDTSSILSSIPSIKLHQKQNKNRKSFRSTKINIGNEFENLSSFFENDEKKKKKQRRRIGAICLPCPMRCCFAMIVGAVLLPMGLTALLTYIFTSKHTTTMLTTSTTTTTTTSPTTTPTPPCVPTSVGSANILYNATTGNVQYSCFAYAWTSPTTGPVTLAFQLRNDPSIWNLDDVTVYAGATEMLNNTGFETGSLSPWVRTTPNGACGGLAGGVDAFCIPFSGFYALCDESTGCADEISQQFTATAGQLYIVSFWLKSDSASAGMSVTVTLS
ncbi:unnamed protein product [Rotaria socialis]|uniref:Uncharacterized protein n=2 Tax=Rotaria socialis TaxID=392032 RepID=A0A818NA89_9BILA|nr:unnamed protein product [Rotaria socialis]